MYDFDTPLDYRKPRGPRWFRIQLEKSGRITDVKHLVDIYGENFCSAKCDPNMAGWYVGGLKTLLATDRCAACQLTLIARPQNAIS